MIYTLTFNPSLDYVITVDDFQTGIVNRTKQELVFPGGKGVNVSMVLSNLGIDNTALGFIAGFTGNKLQELLKDKGISTDFISVDKGMSRINIKMRSKEETEINGIGPFIPERYVEELFIKLDQLKDGDMLVLAGSVPDSMPPDIYNRIMKKIHGKGIKIVVDATRDLLWNVLEYKPFLIKPNHHELGELFGKVLTTKEEIITCAKDLQRLGARNVLVSMAKDGAIFVKEEGEVFIADAPKGMVVNSVGAGDSMVAGFLAGYLKNKNYKDALLYGICTGSASAFSENLATKEDVEKLIDKIKGNE